MENYYYLCFRANALHLTLRVRLLAMSAAFDFRKCKRLLLSSLAVSALYRGPRGIRTKGDVNGAARHRAVLRYIAKRHKVSAKIDTLHNARKRKRFPNANLRLGSLPHGTDSFAI